MKFQIVNESRGRMRVHMCASRMTCAQADALAYFLQTTPGIKTSKVYETTGDAVIFYEAEAKETRTAVISALRGFRYETAQTPEHVLATSGRAMNAGYKERLALRVLLRLTSKLVVPLYIRDLYAFFKSFAYLKKGLQSLAKGKIEVSVLDAAAIGASVLRDDLQTASSIMFLLGIGDLIEEWTHKKSVDDLARSLSLNVGKVWKKTAEGEVLVASSGIAAGDEVIVRMGNLIPFDGTVSAGAASVNQASLTGEAVPVAKEETDYVYAGTVIEEGELTIRVDNVQGGSRFEKIVGMIEESEKLKSDVESKAEHLADRLVPYSLAGTALTYLVTRNVTRAMAILMVDFSCALKLAMPISVLSAIREAGAGGITVKGGKFLEAVAEADTIVFDKTGTLTKAKPCVAKVVSFNGEGEDELLRIAACLEEHFPHSIATAVVNAAEERGLLHEEMHTRVEYVVAHGISTSIEGKQALIGSRHFIFDDEGCSVPEGKEALYKELPEEYTQLFLAIEKKLAAVICIEDPLREEAAEVVKGLKAAGISKVVMMTGDSRRTAEAIAKKIGVTEYYAEVLPGDKAKFVEKERENGRRVIMVGDGINDSPALSAADTGVAIREGAELAREIADITIGEGDLRQLLTLKRLSNALMDRIHGNYRAIVGFNLGLILLGVMGALPNATSALLHNASTVAISVGSMRDLLPAGKG